MDTTRKINAYFIDLSSLKHKNEFYLQLTFASRINNSFTAYKWYTSTNIIN